MLVSVFIPTYNSSSTIARTIDCVLNQTYKEIEICLVDDCSSDNTLDILKSYSSKYSCIKVLQKDKNGGFVPDSWNRVFPHLRGEFTFYMSHDDLISPDCIERLVKTQQVTSADTIIPDCVFVYEDGSQKSTVLQSAILLPKQAFAKMLNYDIPGFALWRTSLIKSIGMPTEAFNSDEGMQRIWALNSNRVILDKDAKFYYLIKSSSITKGLRPYHLSGLKTQKMLAISLLKQGIIFSYPKMSFRFIWAYFKSYIYLKTNLKS